MAPHPLREPHLVGGVDESDKPNGIGPAEPSAGSKSL